MILRELPRACTLCLKLLLLHFLVVPQVMGQNKCPKAENLQATDITDHSALLQWTGGDANLTYQVKVMHGQGTKAFKWDAETSETSIQIDGLDPGSTYRFQIKTTCDKGSGGASQWKEFTTTGDRDSNDDQGKGDDSKPGKCPKASNLAVLNVTDTSVTLTWLGDEDHVDYRVDVHQKEHTSQFRLSETVDTTVLEVDGLEPGGNYKFRVKASCDRNKAGSSSWINFTTTGGDTTFNQCPKPRNLSVLEVTDSSALLSWIALDSVASFTLDIKSFQGTPSYSFTETLTDTFKLVDDLVADGFYQFRVVANCSEDANSGSSDWSKFKTLPDTSDQDSGVDDPLDEPADSTQTAPAINTFPNPASSEITIQLPEEELGYITYIILTDLTGRVVYQNEIEGTVKIGQVQIPISELTEGMYKLVVRSIDYQQTKTIMVHR